LAKIFFTIYKLFIDLIEVALICAVVFFLVYLFIGQLLEVTGDSMFPNFHDKDQVLAERLSTKFVEVLRGEVVIFKHPQDPNKLLIKRVVGLPGEKIRLSNGLVYINDIALDEPYLALGVKTSQEQFFQEGIEYKIPSDSYVMLGDNRPKSTDSREWGYVSKDTIVGRAVLIYYPIQRIKLISRSLF
jgi:signal peptidase I